MMTRWKSHIAKIPAADLQDIHSDNYHMNGGECCHEEHVNQAEPEYSQLSYLRLRSLEEVYAMQNYLDPKLNSRFNEFLKK